jgi:hypothetical protein
MLYNVQSQNVIKICIPVFHLRITYALYSILSRSGACMYPVLVVRHKKHRAFLIRWTRNEGGLKNIEPVSRKTWFGKSSC